MIGLAGFLVFGIIGLVFLALGYRHAEGDGFDITGADVVAVAAFVLAGLFLISGMSAA